jgi:hypothetical protein
MDYCAGPTDKRASLRGEYKNFLIPQTSSDVISTYPLANQQGVSGGEDDADQRSKRNSTRSLEEEPGRSRPRELGRYELTRQPYGRTRRPEG